MGPQNNLKVVVPASSQNNQKGETRRPEWPCLLARCSRVFKTWGQLAEHRDQSHKSLSLIRLKSVVLQVEKDPNEMFWCPLIACEENRDSSYGIAKHVRGHCKQPLLMPPNDQNPIRPTALVLFKLRDLLVDNTCILFSDDSVALSSNIRDTSPSKIDAFVEEDQTGISFVEQLRSARNGKDNAEVVQNSEIISGESMEEERTEEVGHNVDEGEDFQEYDVEEEYMKAEDAGYFN